MNTNMKKTYVSPKMDIFNIELEQGIAAGSANVTPGDNTQTVQHEWDVAPDDTRSLDW